MKKEIICLFEESGLSGAAWAEAGYRVYCYDILHKERSEIKLGLGSLVLMPWDATKAGAADKIVQRHKGKAAITLSYPPCTDLAVSGARHFASKLAKNPRYKKQAMDLVYIGWEIALRLDTPFCIENPISVISTEWRKPDYIFHPHEYGGYLPEDDVHPLYPEFIEPRDAYVKTTCYWTGNGFVMPEKKPVPYKKGEYSKQYTQLGGKSEKTKRIRSASPRGISRAIYLFNKNLEENS